MSLWLARATVLAATCALVLIPAIVHHRDPQAKVRRSRRGPQERLLLGLASVGFVLPLVWVATPLLAFADHALRPAPFLAGLACLALGLWLLQHSHADLGPSWSITLELRESHALVTRGVYRHVRHPMYVALLLYGAGQALVLPNWLAGPFYLVAIVLLVALRLAPEERLLLEEFGADYEAYRARTRRLVPGVW